MTMPQLTSDVLDHVADAVRRGASPLVVLDLDGTLYDNAPRTLRIIQEFAAANAARIPDLYEIVTTLAPSAMRYKLADTLGAAGVTDPAIHRELEAYWFARFFTNEYVLYDLPLAGAAEFVNLIHRAGAIPTYLTGRDAPNMLQGTIASLQRDGFPVGPIDTRTILKQDFDTPDEAFKRSVVAHLRTGGEVVASFDNEPGLCNLLKTSFPSSVTVWLDTSHAPGAPALIDSVARIRRFTELLPTD